ncbi:MAG: hypothetical protein K2K05_03075, partial [Muribaculaceae bacterium]|nr:hypothetical protein [Muribaculaceae bacterium]
NHYSTNSVLLMKKFVLFLISFLPFTMVADNYFHEGMKWITYIVGTHEPRPIWSRQEARLEKCEEHDCYILRVSYIDETSMTRYLYIRTDEDKVFFKYDDHISPDWYLLYDFGLEPGEGCYIYTPQLYDFGPHTPPSSYIKCVAINEDAAYDGWSIMALEELSDDTGSVMYGRGSWIKGLSSLDGLLNNIYFEAAGGGGILTEVIDNGTVIFTNPSCDSESIMDCRMPDIRIVGQEIVVSSDRDVCGTLHSQSGTHIGDYRFGDSCTHIRVPSPGVYILTIEGFSKKIMVP